MGSFNLLELISVIASLATAVGIILAWWQIKLAKQQSIIQFEDSMAREYREIALKLPVKALLGCQLEGEEYEKALEYFYHYVDLSNEQIYLYQNNRINSETWNSWCDGIKANLSRPAFRKAWEDIKLQANGDFKELRKLDEGNFKIDPRSWKKK